jgi:hypothetical protein
LAHEDYRRDEKIKGSSNRSFGLVIGAFLALVALAPLVREQAGPVRWWALAVAAAFVSSAFFWPAPLAPLNRLWTKLGLLLFRIVSPIVMALLFFGTVTPIGFLMRRAGKDPLRLRRDPAAKSYWIERDPPGPAPDTMTRQF